METTLTARQIGKVIDLAEQKGQTPERFQEVLGSGYLSDIFEHDARLGNRNALREVLGLPPLQLIIEVDYGMPFEQMVAEGRYDWRNDNLNEKNFPIKGKGKRHFECKLFDANCSSKQGVERIEAAGFKPGATEHILKFGATFPEIQRKTPIVGLGSTARVGGRVDVPCLGRGGAGRGLGLSWWGGGWPGDWRLLGVREVSGPRT